MAGSLPHNFVSPLRYPGGKQKLANFIKLLFLHNDLVGHHYVEPYAGGASVALALLFEEYASHIHINDLNRSVYAFWWAVLNDTEKLCSRIQAAKLSIREWKRQKAVQEADDPDPLDLAFSTFYLNRTNRSGIISGGVIGGMGQNGKWKLDSRFNKPDLVKRIKKIARFRTRITLTNQDAAEYLRNTLPQFQDSYFVYLDPPYFVKGEGLYEHSYDTKNHVEIAGLVRKIQEPWLVSYDAVREALKLYSETEIRHLVYDLAYSAAERQRGSEVMFFSPSLKRPTVDTPANIHIKTVNRFRMEPALFREAPISLDNCGSPPD